MAAAGKDDYQKSLGCGMCIEITANGEQTSPSTGGPTPMKGIYKAYVGDLCGGCNQGTPVLCTRRLFTYDCLIDLFIYIKQLDVGAA